MLHEIVYLKNASKFAIFVELENPNSICFSFDIPRLGHSFNKNTKLINMKNILCTYIWVLLFQK